MKKASIIISTIVILLFCSFSSSFGQSRDIFKESGIIKITSLSFFNGFDEIAYGSHLIDNYQTSISIHQVIGNMFNPYFSLGFGIGFEKWKYTSFVPIYADFRFNLYSGRYSPHIYTDLGYATKWYQSPKPESKNQVFNGATQGLYAETGIGFKVMVSSSASTIFTFSYKLQETSINYSDEYNLFPQITTNRAERVLYHFLGGKIAYQF